MPFYLMKNSVQHYAWGSLTAIPRLLGVENPGGEPIAELWMGAHPDGPSRVDYQGQEITLEHLIAQNPVTMLGERTVQRFGKQLPFLLKVLAADTALSIQVHPSQRDAEAGFARENQAGTELNDPARNYRDVNHKPEVLCAIEQVWGLCGFRSLEQIRNEFAQPEFGSVDADRLRAALDSSDNEATAKIALLEVLLKHSTEQTGRLIAAALRVAQRSNAAPTAKGAAEENPADARYSWLVRLASQFPGDAGVLAPLFLELFKLEPGQAIFVGAGALHTYLHGCGIELMTSSNNVLRGGLTRKRIDVAELLRTVDATAPAAGILKDLEPQILRSRQGVPAGRRWDFPTPAAEFRLQRLLIESDEPVLQQRAAYPEIAFCRAGRARFSSAAGFQTITRGDSLMITATETEYTMSGPGEIYLATVGL